MTMRLQPGILQRLRYCRTKCLCWVVTIRRRDEVVTRLTSLDRPITIDGEVYETASLASMSAERRDAALRVSSQEVIGIVDGVAFTLPGLRTGVYRGAIVTTQVVDWRTPWLPIYEAKKSIQDMVQDGLRWKATLVGIADRLMVPVGGRFGGTWQSGCPYRYGDRATCRKAIGPDVKLDQAATGTSTGGNTGTTLVHTGAGWTVNQWAGQRVHIYSGPGAWQMRTVASNTSSVLTLATPWDPDGIPTSASTYEIGLGPLVAAVVTQRQVVEMSVAAFPGTYVDDYYREGEIRWTVGANAGTVSPILYYRHATRRLTLLHPTPADITTTDRGIVVPGCDGIKSTCVSRGNVVNFGGSDYDPGIEQMLESAT